MNSYPRGIVDVDDVKIGLVPAACAWFNRNYPVLVMERLGRHMRPTDFRKYDIGYVLGLEPQETQSYLAAFAISPEYRDAWPVSGANKAIARLSKQFELHSLTLRRNQPHIVETTEYQVSRYFGNAFDGRVHVVGNPNGALGSKAPICVELKPAWAVEDQTEYAREMEGCDVPLVVLLDAPWNRGIEDTKRIKRARNWKRAVSLIESAVQ